MKWIVKNGIFLFVLCTFLGANGQSIFGKWKTVDDRTGEIKSIVNIYNKDGKVFGDVVHVYIDPQLDTCSVKYKKAQKVEGTTIIKNMEKVGEQYENGTITDPENDKTYKAKIWLNEDNPNILNVRGYIGIFYRTQNWVRLKKNSQEK